MLKKVTKFYWECDGHKCQEQFPPPGEDLYIDLRHLQSQGKKAGWYSKNMMHFCPKHAALGRAGLEPATSRV